MAGWATSGDFPLEVHVSSVYFLGAGATKAVYPNAPLGDDLLHVVLRDDLGDDSLLAFLESSYEPSQLAPGSAAEDRPRLEDVFTLLDSAIHGRAPYPRSVSPATVHDIRLSLVASMGQALETALRGSNGDTALRFADLVHREDAVVISTNYDIVTDNALYSGSPQSVNYGVPARAAVVTGPEPSPSIRQAEARHFEIDEGMHDTIRTGETELLKLHGSLNWLYCPRCDEFDVCLGEKATVMILENPILGRCAAGLCTGRYEPILVGPSLEQRYENRILRDTWQRAEQALHRAESLVFVGYSLPEADYLIRSLVSRHFSTRSDRVTVVGHGEPSEGSLSAEVERRYKRLFPRAECEWEGFSSYVEKRLAS